MSSLASSKAVTTPEIELTVPHYSALLPRAALQLDSGDELDPTVLSMEEQEFLIAVLQDAFAHDDPVEFNRLAAVGMTLGGGMPALPTRLNRLLLALDGRWPHASRPVIWVLHEVYGYLHDERAASEVRALIRGEAPPNVEVIIGHSLGSVIAYDLLRRGHFPSAHTLVTVGSPLSFPTITRALAHPLNGRSAPTRLPEVTWASAYDDRDPVTGGKGLRHIWPQVTDIPVQNPRRDSHSIRGYLGNCDVAEAICVDLQ